MFSLGFDTSNYATSLAVVDITAKEVVCAKKKFLPVKDGELGLRQSDALFFHTKNIPLMLDEISEEFDLGNITSVGVSERPRPVNGSYMPCFLAGVSAASAFSKAKQLQLVKTTHQQGHIAAAMFALANQIDLKKDHIVFHISGGTTDMILYKGIDSISEIGTSSDLYAGQAVDRLGVSLGYPFPAGKYISDLAMKCAEPIKLYSHVNGCYCSLSGLENLCQKKLKDGKSPEYVSKFCLLSVAQTIVEMSQNARMQYGDLPIICAGGVMSSEPIARFVSGRLENVFFVSSLFSSDNAIGTAAIAGGLFHG